MLGMLEKDFFPSARKDVEKDGKGVRRSTLGDVEREGKKLLNSF